MLGAVDLMGEGEFGRGTKRALVVGWTKLIWGGVSYPFSSFVG